MQRQQQQQRNGERERGGGGYCLLLLGDMRTGGRLEHGRRRHEIFNVLAEHLVLGAQLQVFLLDAIDALREI